MDESDRRVTKETEGGIHCQPDKEGRREEGRRTGADGGMSRAGEEKKERFREKQGSRMKSLESGEQRGGRSGTRVNI